MYDDYIFTKMNFNVHSYSSITLYSKREKSADTCNTLTIKGFDDGWTHEQTELVLLLHPTDRSKILEFHQINSFEYQGYYQWSVGGVNKEYGCEGYVLICFKKKTNSYNFGDKNDENE